MTPSEIKALKLIEALECDQAFSQRDLADKLDISLGLVNAFIKKFLKKGIITVKTLPKKKVEYLITPKGFTEKSLLKNRYILYSLSFYKELKNKFDSLFIKLENEGKRRIVLFGAGELVEIALIVIKRKNMKLINVIHHASQLEGLVYDTILILEPDNQESTEKMLLESGAPRHKISSL